MIAKISLPLALVTLALAGCVSGTPAPDYTSYKTANPYGPGPYAGGYGVNQQGAPAPQAAAVQPVAAAPVVAAYPAPATGAIQPMITRPDGTVVPAYTQEQLAAQGTHLTPGGAFAVNLGTEILARSIVNAIFN